MRTHHFSVLPDTYAVVGLRPDDPIPDRVLKGTPLVSVTRTDDELSIVCREADAPPAPLARGGWRLLKLHGPFEFDEIGVLLSFAAPLAEHRISILALGTFDTDYILIDGTQLDEAVKVLTAAGHRLVPAP